MLLTLRSPITDLRWLAEGRRPYDPIVDGPFGDRAVRQPGFVAGLGPLARRPMRVGKGRRENIYLDVAGRLKFPGLAEALGERQVELRSIHRRAWLPYANRCLIDLDIQFDLGRFSLPSGSPWRGGFSRVDVDSVSRMVLNRMVTLPAVPVPASPVPQRTGSSNANNCTFLSASKIIADRYFWATHGGDPHGRDLIKNHRWLGMAEVFHAAASASGGTEIQVSYSDLRVDSGAEFRLVVVEAFGDSVKLRRQVRDLRLRVASWHSTLSLLDHLRRDLAAKTPRLGWSSLEDSEVCGGPRGDMLQEVVLSSCRNARDISNRSSGEFDILRHAGLDNLQNEEMWEALERGLVGARPKINRALKDVPAMIANSRNEGASVSNYHFTATSGGQLHIGGVGEGNIVVQRIGSLPASTEIEALLEQTDLRVLVLELRRLAESEDSVEVAQRVVAAEAAQAIEQCESGRAAQALRKLGDWVGSGLVGTGLSSGLPVLMSLFNVG